MALFELKPTRVWAFQWDGTHEGALELSKFIEENSPRTLTFTIIGTVGRDAIFSRIQFNAPFDAQMRKGDWFVIDVKGHTSIIPGDLFERDYFEVSDE